MQQKYINYAYKHLVSHSSTLQATWVKKLNIVKKQISIQLDIIIFQKRLETKFFKLIFFKLFQENLNSKIGVQNAHKQKHTFFPVKIASSCIIKFFQFPSKMINTRALNFAVPVLFSNKVHIANYE